MTKVSEARSDARRFLLAGSVKLAQQEPVPATPWQERLMMWMDPAHAGGLGLSVGGGLTLLDALRGEKSFMRRLTQAGLGAGMLYGGHQALSNPAVQRQVNRYVGQATDWAKQYIGALVQRIHARAAQ